LHAAINELQQYRAHATRFDRVRAGIETALMWFAGVGTGLAGLVVVDAAALRVGLKTEVIPYWALVLAAAALPVKAITFFAWRRLAATLPSVAGLRSKYRWRRYIIAVTFFACYAFMGIPWTVAWGVLLVGYAVGCYTAFMFLISYHGKQRFDAASRR
jgi:hypothetical protein